MEESRPRRLGQIDGEAFEAWLAEGGWIRASLLSALLDAHLLFQEEYLSSGTPQPLFEVWWPEVSLAEVWERLRRDALVEPCPGGAFAVPEQLRRPLAAALESQLWGHPLNLPDGTTNFGRLMAGFSEYCQTELGITPDAGASMEVWGGVAVHLSGRLQILVLRPGLLRLRAHPEAHLLVVCPLPDAVAQSVAPRFTIEPALRHRLALYDLESGEKINLTRGELSVYFERYLRQAHGLRMAPSPALTSSLSDSGLLNLNKG